MNYTWRQILTLRRAATRIHKAADREAARHNWLQRQLQQLQNALQHDAETIRRRSARLQPWEVAAWTRRQQWLDHQFAAILPQEQQARNAQRLLRSRAQRFEVLQLHAHKELQTTLRRKEDVERSSQDD